MQTTEQLIQTVNQFYKANLELEKQLADALAQRNAFEERTLKAERQFVVANFNGNCEGELARKLRDLLAESIPHIEDADLVARINAAIDPFRSGSDWLAVAMEAHERMTREQASRNGGVTIRLEIPPHPVSGKREGRGD